MQKPFPMPFAKLVTVGPPMQIGAAFVGFTEINSFPVQLPPIGTAVPVVAILTCAT
jgi:hypothetical protein